MGVREFSWVLYAVLFSGCAGDYLNHYDTVTLAAGGAGHANLLLQTLDPFNPNSQNTHIEGDGVRAAAVVNRYRGVSQHRRNCHGRAAAIWIAQAARETIPSWLAR